MDSNNIVYPSEWSELKISFFNHIKFHKETPTQFGRSTFYYLKKFDQYQKGNKKLGWNWPAFLLGSIWGAYRQNYFILWVDLLINNVFTIIITWSIYLMMHNLPEYLVAYRSDTIDKKILIFVILFNIVFILISIFWRVYIGIKANKIYIEKKLNDIEKNVAPKRPKIWYGLGLLIFNVLLAEILSMILDFFN